MTRYHDHALFALRLGLAGLFAYFGALAVIDPSSQLLWLSGWVRALPLVGTEAFISVLGVAQLLLAAALALGLYLRVAALLAAGALLCVIVNLGPGEVAMRDAVLLIGALVVASQQRYHWALRP